MRRSLGRIGALGATAAVVGLGAAAYALAADETIVASASCMPHCQYTQSTYTISGGAVAQFSNPNPLSHSVLSNDRFGGRAEFASKVIHRSTTTADGTQYLADGTYEFHCAIHGPAMSATLKVSGGAPVARPAITVEITSTKVSAVRHSGRLAVNVADTGSDGTVDLIAKLGHKTLAAKSNVSVAAGDNRDLDVKLAKKGAKALKGLHTAKIKLGGRVDFGSPASTTKTLD